MNYWKLKKIANGARLSWGDICLISAEVYCNYDIHISDNSFELIKVGKHLCDTDTGLPEFFIQGDCAFFRIETSIDKRNYTRYCFYVRHDLVLLTQPILEQRA